MNFKKNIFLTVCTDGKESDKEGEMVREMVRKEDREREMKGEEEVETERIKGWEKVNGIREHASLTSCFRRYPTQLTDPYAFTTMAMQMHRK